jgi:hypothetical protein
MKNQMKKTSILRIQAGSSLRKAILLPIVMLMLLFCSTNLSAEGIYSKNTTLTTSTEEVKDLNQQLRAGGGDGIFIKEDAPIYDSFSFWIFAVIMYGLYARKKAASPKRELQK